MTTETWAGLCIGTDMSVLAVTGYIVHYMCAIIHGTYDIWVIIHALCL